MGLRETASTLWPSRRTVYVAYDGKPPREWREAPRPSLAPAVTTEAAGIETKADRFEADADRFEADADSSEAEADSIDTAVNSIVPEADGIEVLEQAAGGATVVETRYRIRCACGRRWWAMSLEPTTCPRCNRWVSIQLSS